MRAPGIMVDDPELDAHFLEIMRQATPTQRLSLSLALTSAARSRLELELRRHDPSADDREIRLRAAEYLYGDDVMSGVRVHLAQRMRADN